MLNPTASHEGGWDSLCPIDGRQPRTPWFSPPHGAAPWGTKRCLSPVPGSRQGVRRGQFTAPVAEPFVTPSPGTLFYPCCACFIGVEQREAGAEGSLGGKALK